MTRKKILAVALVLAVVVGMGGPASALGIGGIAQMDDAGNAGNQPGDVGNQPTEAVGLSVVDFASVDSAAPGSEVTVVATVENSGDQRQAETVSLRTAGSSMEADLSDRTTVVLDPGEQTTVELTWETDGLPTGEYTVSVDSESNSVLGTVLLSESFSLDTLDAPANVTVGDTVTVNATVSNPNDIETTQTVDFRLSGQVLGSSSVTLGAGESTNLTFETSTAGLETGNYTHSVFTRGGGQFATLAVEPDLPDQATASFDDQETDGTTVTVQNLTLPESGYVAVHDSSLLEGNVVGSVIGVSGYLEAGAYENVTVTLFDVPGTAFNETELTEDDVLIAMPHQETGDNQTYDFVRTNGTEDGPFTVDGQAVVDDSIVTVPEAPDGNMTDGMDDNATDGNMTDGMDDNATDGMDDNATDGNTTDGMDDNMTDGDATDGNMTDGMDDNATDGNMTDGDATDGNATDGNTTDGSTDNGTDTGDATAPPASDSEEDNATDGNATES